MKVILREDVASLGIMGDIVNVKPGYARNFLLPRGLASEADPKNIKAFEHEKKVIHEKVRKTRETAQALSDRISAMALSLKAKAGEEEKLFGSITSMDIAEALKEQGVEVDKKKILLDEPLKRLGLYEVGVKLSADVTAKVKVEISAE